MRESTKVSSFVSYSVFLSTAKVSFKKSVGQVAKFTHIEISTIGLRPILSDKSTIRGAKRPP
jgi:hypothetical protein